MILSVEALQGYTEFSDMDQEELASLSDAIELMIRRYTNNDFAMRRARICGISDADGVLGYSPLLSEGDRVQITGSVNAGLYTVKQIEADRITLDRGLYPGVYNCVTRVVYPEDVRRGALNLMKWEAQNRDKVGVKSESLSRWSVTYYDQDAGNTVMGYPVSLLGFLKPYRRARF